MSGSLSIDALLDLGQRGDVNQFISIATKVLLHGVDHDPLRLLLTRRLAERGLLRAAAEIARGAGAALLRSAEYGRMLRTLTSQPRDGYVPIASLTFRYQANLAALRERYTWAAPLDAAWRAVAERFSFHQGADGQWQILRGGAGGGWCPVFGLQPAGQTREAQRTVHEGRIVYPIVIEGVGIGAHLPAVFAATQATFLGASALLYQVESSYVALAAALHLHDWTGLIAAPRVQICCGPTAYEQLERAIQSEADAPPPQTLLRVPSWETPPSGAPGIEAVLRRLCEEYEAARVALFEPLERLSAQRDAAWWARRFEAARSGAGPPLRVLGITSRFTTVLQYSMRDALAAFEEAGCVTRMLIEQADHHLATPQRTLVALREFDPDLVFLIDHTRAGMSASLVAGLPVLTWVQDRLPWLFRRETGAALGPLDFCMGVGRRELTRQHGYPASRYFATEMATRPRSLGDAESDARDAREHGDDLTCDLAFASNWSTSPQVLHEQLRCKVADTWHPLLDACYSELRARLESDRLNGGLFLEHFLECVAASSGVSLPRAVGGELSANYLRPLLDCLIRHQTLEWAARWAESSGRRFFLYGNGWEKHPRFAPFARGFIAHGPRLGRAFRAARINLHAGVNPALHPRVLDGLAAGGFFLARLHAHDVSYDVSQGVYDWIRQRHAGAPRRLRLPVEGRAAPRDLPPALRAQRDALCALTGADPRAPFVLGPADLERFVALHDEKTEHVASGIWPDFVRVTFSTEIEMVERLEKFLGDDAERARVAQSLREPVLKLFTYDAVIANVLCWLQQRLEQACGAAKAGAVLNGDSNRT